ncbi:hypothetical protein MB828_23745 [Streptomyces arenae]|nr:hypothetical protein [Streptomyces arenae]
MRSPAGITGPGAVTAKAWWDSWPAPRSSAATASSGEPGGTGSAKISTVRPATGTCTIPTRLSARAAP